MKSLYARILLWCLGTLLLSGTAFLWINARPPFPPRGRANPMGRISVFQMEQAVETLNRDGKPGLERLLARLDGHFGPAHHLADASGRDVMTGEDFSPLLREIEFNVPQRSEGRFTLARRSPDGRYIFLVHGVNQFDPWEVVPYYAVIFGAVVFLLWLLASQLVSPLRALAAVMDRFGSGDLDARFPEGRRDEIGSLGASFNQMAERLRTLLVAERRLLQDVSHELRSPLARLSFATRLARTAPDRDAAIDRIKKEIERLTELVSSLIEVTRAEGDPAERAAMEAMDLESLVSRVIAACQLDAQSNGCRIDYADGHGPVPVNGNAELLRRAVENITRNAIRYAPAGTAIEVGVGVERGEAVVTVRDHGPGVPPENLGRIFDPFFRVESSRDSKEGGVGLGLAIARRAVSVHSGALTAENAGPGLRVIMRLPLAPVETAAPAQPVA